LQYNQYTQPSQVAQYNQYPSQNTSSGFAPASNTQNHHWFQDPETGHYYRDVNGWREWA
jgi:hypothetical protein